MEEVVIITRDVNGKRSEHYLRWDDVCEYIDTNRECLQDDEILLVLVEGACIYSGLWTVDQMTWESLVGFFG